MSVDRPAPGWKAPDGFMHVAVPEDDDWSPQPMSKGNCRHMRQGFSCGRPAVLSIRRGTRRPVWWDYCEEHAFGRWVEDGQVMYWVVRPSMSAVDDESEAPR